MTDYTKTEIETLVCKRISKLAPRFLIDPKTSLQEDLGLDSMDITVLLMEIERELNIDLSTIPLHPILTVGDIITSFYSAS